MAASETGRALWSRSDSAFLLRLPAWRRPGLGHFGGDLGSRRADRRPPEGASRSCGPQTAARAEASSARTSATRRSSESTSAGWQRVRCGTCSSCAAIVHAAGRPPSGLEGRRASGGSFGAWPGRDLVGHAVRLCLAADQSHPATSRLAPYPSQPPGAWAGAQPLGHGPAQPDPSPGGGSLPARAGGDRPRSESIAGHAAAAAVRWPKTAWSRSPSAARAAAPSRYPS